MNIPGIATAGDTITWVDSDVFDYQGNSYSPGTGYLLNYSLRGPAALDVAAVVADGQWTVTITPTQSATLTAGQYFWTAYVSDAAGDRFTVGTGQITIQVDLTKAAAGYDGRSQAKQIIDAINAEMLARINNGAAMEYTIAGRSLRKETLQALQALRAEWVGIYAKEVRAQRMAQGLGDPTARFVQFRRPGNFTGGNGNW
ncbi:MAG: hypothetical protein POG24_07690 [Acidocella sp.]|nr:hypothetical protein [Acidocella sp.]MDE8350208.1 hypothetical protein [Acidocella sp.]